MQNQMALHLIGWFSKKVHTCYVEGPRLEPQQVLNWNNSLTAFLLMNYLVFSI